MLLLLAGTKSAGRKLTTRDDPPAPRRSAAVRPVSEICGMDILSQGMASGTGSLTYLLYGFQHLSTKELKRMGYEGDLLANAN